MNSKVLIIDDSSSVRSWLSKEIEDLGAEVVCARNGEEGLGLALNGRFDLIVTDVLMPGLDGFELCRRLKEHPTTGSVPVVILSTEGSDEDIEKGFEAGASAYIPKIHAERDLRPYLKEALNRSSLLTGRRVLVVDDSRAIRTTVASYFQGAGYAVHTAEDGLEAMSWLESGGAPDIILTDIHMPRLDGMGLCEAVRAVPRLARLPIVVMSTASDRGTMRRLLQHGATAYLVKPFNLEQLLITAERILADHHRLILKDQEKLTAERNLLFAAIGSLVQALEARDPYTRGHSDNVAEVATSMGRRMGLDRTQLEHLNLAGRLHDIGKIGVRDSVLLKPGKLTSDEEEIIRLHPVIGSDILRPIPSLGEIASAILHHHERMDGRGYPHGIAGSAIPLWSRMLAVADTYDALTSDRPYRQGMDRAHAFEIIRRAAGNQLCPDCVGVFFAVMEEGAHGE